MANDSLPFCPVIRIGEGEFEALAICLTQGLAALKIRSFQSLEPSIMVSLIEIGSIYGTITGKPIEQGWKTNHAELIKLTLEAFEQNHDTGSDYYYRFLRIVEKLINNVVTVFSVVHAGQRDAYTFCFSENYDKLIGFLRRIESTLLSKRLT